MSEQHGDESSTRVGDNEQTRREAEAVARARRDAEAASPGSSDRPRNAPQIEGYDFIRELHRGGQGVVYQAIEKATKRKVAVKVLLEGPYASEAARRRFEREIELAASLKHPNIVAVFHSGLTPDGRQFCVMDYIRGVPLHQYVREQKLGLEEALKLFAKVCEAVNYAHQKGIIHRDLKPSNILVDSDGSPKVLDFGLAKLVGGPEQTLVSMTGQVVGTLPYLSPEQARGNPDEIDIRTDVYSLGVVLYEMLTGQFPYPVIGQMADVLRHIAATEPTPPSRSWRPNSGVTERAVGRKSKLGSCPIDEEVQTIVLRALTKERQRRYQSAADLGKDIEHYLRNEPIEAKKDSALYVLGKQLHRYRTPVAIAAAFVMLLAGFSVTMTVFAKRNSDLAKAEAEARRTAEIKTLDAETARAAEVRTREAIEYNSYVANVEMAAAAIDMRQFNRVRGRLDACSPRLRGWEWGWLSAESDSSLLELKGHTGSVRAAAFSPDGKLIVTGSADKTARVWNAASGACLIKLKGHQQTVHSAEFNADGTRVYTASDDSTQRMWDATTGAYLGEYKGTIQSKRSDVSPDGKRRVTGGMHAASVLDTATESIYALRGYEGVLESVAFSSDGTRIVTGSWDNSAEVWIAATGVRQVDLRGHTGFVGSVRFSPDGTRIATGSGDKTARIWNAETGESVTELRGHTHSVLVAAFGSDGTRLVTGSLDTTARVWDATIGPNSVEINNRLLMVYSVGLSPDCSKMVAATTGEKAIIWNTASGTVTTDLEGHTQQVNFAAFSSDGRRVVTASQDKSARVWNAESGECLAVLKGHTASVQYAAFSLDGSRIVTASNDQSLQIWNAKTGVSLTKFDSDMGIEKPVGFSPDGTRIVTTSGENSAQVLVAETGVRRFKLEGHTDNVVSAGFSSDGTRVITVSLDNTARVWDATQGASLVVLKGHTGFVRSAALNPDGTRLVTASADKTARVWDSSTGVCLAELKDHSLGVTAAAFNADGTRIVTVSHEFPHNLQVHTWDCVPYRIRFAENQRRERGEKSVNLGVEYMREVRGITPASWLSDPSLEVNRPGYGFTMPQTKSQASN